MKLLHTSDWHLGRSLYGKKRYDEFTAFLSWLAATIQAEAIDVLLVAGDIFDSTTPSNRAQRLYYQFLRDASDAGCQHIVMIGGNHDSPSLLEAPRELLHLFHVHVIGSAGKPESEVITIQDDDGKDRLIICAVPYLRDRDIRFSGPNETIEEKSSNLLRGIAEHYRTVCALAQHKQATSTQSPAIVAMGHLFTAGGQRVEGDGVRDLYIGSLAHLPAHLFPDCIDYLALGHLHTPQQVGGSTTRRYCGSPLPISFGEANQEKCVLLVAFEDTSPTVTTLAVPRFQHLKTLQGSVDHLLGEIAALKREDSTAWLELIYDGEEIVSDLQNRLREAITGSNLEILRIVNTRMIQAVLQRTGLEEKLDEMSEEQVFLRRLETANTPQAQRTELLQLFRQALQAVHEEDPNAE